MTAPVLTGFAPTITFDENTVNATPQLLDPAVVFTDAEGDFDGGTLSLSGLLAEDRVSVLNQGTGAGQIGLSGGNVSYAGIVIGTLTGGSGTTLGISFNAAATSLAIDALIQNLTYANVSDTPTAVRTLVLNLYDTLGQDTVPTTFTPLGLMANPFMGTRADFNSTPSFVDLDGDGDLDLVSGEVFGVLKVWTNAAGVYTEQTEGANPFNGIDVGSNSAPSFVDLDGDGDFDLVSGESDGTLNVWTNAGGVFTAKIGAANPFNGADVGDNSAPTFVDLDGDGDLDLVAGGNSGMFRTWVNTGGVFTAQIGAASLFDGIDVGSDSKPSFVDLDGDGDLDLVSGAYDGTLKVWANADGVFAEQTGLANPFNGIDVGIVSTPNFVDLDGDGDLDLVVGEFSGNLITYKNTTLPGAPIVVTVTAQTDTITGTSGDDTLVGTAGPDLMNGLAGDDTMYGGTGNDILQGNAGNDLLQGEAGNDSYFVDTQGDVIVEFAGNGTADRVTAAVSYVLGANANIELLATTNALGTEALNLTGNALAQMIIGNAGSNRLGDGLGAADTLIGGDGNDQYNVESLGTRVFEAVGGGFDVALVHLSFALAAGSEVETVAVYDDTSTFAINLTGNALAQIIQGNAGANVLDSGQGLADQLNGGAGNDTYIIRNTGDQIIEIGGDAGDRVVAAVSYALQADDTIWVMQTISAAEGTSINLTGNSLAQTITGNAGINRLEDGLGGADTLIGRAGDDVYIVDSVGTVVVELAGGGSDILYSNGSYALDAGLSIEQLSAQNSDGTTAINMTGNAFRQFLSGNAGANVLDGGLGSADMLNGFTGNDTYIVRNTGDDVREFLHDGKADRVIAAVSFALEASDDIELMSTISATATTAINLTGNALAQTITGNAGINRLEDGYGAADTLIGGAGHDTYVVRSAGTRVIEFAGGGTIDRVLASTSFILNIGSAVEFLSTTDVTGTNSINLTGNALAQTIIGNTGINRLEDGLGAADTLIGGAGNDTYVVRNGGTQVLEVAAGGTADRVLVSTTFALAAGSAVEALSTTDAAGTTSINLTGNALAQRITGNDGSNVLADGKGATDTLVGGAGHDTYIISTATAVIIEVAGGGFDRVDTSVSFVLAADDSIELLQANLVLSAPAISLTGNGFAQHVVGNAGDNRLDGKGGSDFLWGNGGLDVFVFSTTLGSTNVDKINNYSVTDDRIDIDNAVFTGLAAGALAATAFASNNTGFAATATQRIIYETDSGFLWFDADGNGVGARVQFAALDGGLAMTASEFMVM